jgi:hypothetical protein
MDIRLLNEKTREELQNLEQKMSLAESAQDIWYIMDRIAKALPNNLELGEYIRSISRTELKKTLDENRKSSNSGNTN